MKPDERKVRQEIIDHCRLMNDRGLNQGTSGNMGVRMGDGMLITPSGRSYDDLVPEDIVYLDSDGTAHGRWQPSSEWRLHFDIMNDRAEVNAVVHAHAPYCTMLAILHRGIPAVHYMIAVFGGDSIRCADYAVFGSQELSDLTLAALEERKACLLAHHGMVTVGADIAQAYWLAEELETLARQYYGCLQLGEEPPVLTARQVDEVLVRIRNYGLNNAC